MNRDNSDIGKESDSWKRPNNFEKPIENDEHFQEESSRNRSRFGRDHWEQQPPQVAENQKEPIGWSRPDEQIKEDASNILWRNQKIDATEIEVTVNNGILSLNGKVNSVEAKKEAEFCVKGVTGVIEVQNNINLELSGKP